jgi:hypothetical protein
MEKIYFDDTTFIWKTKLNKITQKAEQLSEANKIMDSSPDNQTDGFGYKKEWTENIDFMGEIKIETKLDEIVQSGIDLCKEIYINETGKEFNKINTDAWINVVRSKNPVQVNFVNGELNVKNKYHIHTEINKKAEWFVPYYTYVYYIQMPDVMEGEDGVLYFKGQNNKEYWIRPEEDDIIIMPADMPHTPNTALKSTIDRVVMAGNVGFEFIKKEKSLI